MESECELTVSRELRLRPLLRQPLDLCLASQHLRDWPLNDSIN